MTALTHEQEYDKKESTVVSSETKATCKVQTLSDRLTPLLISAGLVRGIIPMSMRKKSNQKTLAFASSKPDGLNADTPKRDC